MDIISITLSFLITLLILAGIIEYYFHLQNLNNIPIRIHINGTRGKSSVTRLIAAGLRGGNLRTFGKTTGTTPRIINNLGNDIEIYRLRSASIGEQIRFIRYFAKRKPEALVIECMAVNPQYQWITEHKIIKSTLGVITNVRPDHLDEMGSTEQDIAYSLCNTIPYNSTVITSEKKNLKFLKEIATERKTVLKETDNNSIDGKFLNSLPYFEHPDNIALALKVCSELGISEKNALQGMSKTIPDPGALFIWHLQYKKVSSIFVSGFAANDPSSTKIVWNLVKDRFNDKKSCIFLNTRDDRIYRTIQLLDLLFNDIKPDYIIIRADNIDSNLKKHKINLDKIKVFNMKSKSENVVAEILKLNDYFILGIGNMVGWGEDFIKNIKKYSS